jgi:hypothetical protein
LIKRKESVQCTINTYLTEGNFMVSRRKYKRAPSRTRGRDAREELAVEALEKIKAAAADAYVAADALLRKGTGRAKGNFAAFSNDDLI